MEDDAVTREDGAPKGRKKTSASPEGLEENLKKGIAELLVLFLLREREMYINEMADVLAARSGGRLNISFPYAIIYRLLDAGYIALGDKQTAPDGRRRQYYRTTEAGVAYLEELLAVLERFMGGVYRIIMGEGETDETEREKAGEQKKEPISPAGQAIPCLSRGGEAAAPAPCGTGSGCIYGRKPLRRRQSVEGMPGRTGGTGGGAAGGLCP